MDILIDLLLTFILSILLIDLAYLFKRYFRKHKFTINRLIRQIKGRG